jgi:uncharacterized Rmd1/YagE family protein
MINWHDIQDRLDELYRIFEKYEDIKQQEKLLNQAKEIING